MNRVFLAINLVDVGNESAFKIELVKIMLAFIHDADPHPGREVRLLAQMVDDSLEIEIPNRKYLRIRLESNFGPGLPAVRGRDLADLAHLALWFAALIILLVDLAVPAHDRGHFLGKRVYHRNTHAVQTAGNFVAARTEFASRVEHGEHRFQGGFFGLLMRFHRDAAAVVAHRHRAVRAQRDGNVFGEACHCLVNAVIHHLPDKVMQTGFGRIADVHPRALADGLEPLEDGDLFRPVFRAGIFLFFVFGH